MKYRVGRKQSRVILDENGHKIAECLEGNEDVAKQICDLLNRYGLVSELPMHDVSTRAFQWGKTLTEEDLKIFNKKYFPKRSEKIAYYIGCRRSDLIKVYKGEHGC